MNGNTLVLIQQLKDIILDNNFFDTMAGERFRDFYDIRNIQAVIAFAGRSRNHASYRLTTDSDSDQMYVTHLYINQTGDVKVQLAGEDTDDFELILHPSNESVFNYDNDTLRKWVQELKL